MEEVQKNENGTTVPQADGKPKKEDNLIGLLIYDFHLLPYAFFVNGFEYFFNDTATTEIYTLSLHDALPI